MSHREASVSRRVRHLSCFHDCRRRRRTLLALSAVLVTVDGEREDKYRNSEVENTQWAQADSES